MSFFRSWGFLREEPLESSDRLLAGHSGTAWKKDGEWIGFCLMSMAPTCQSDRDGFRALQNGRLWCPLLVRLEIPLLMVKRSMCHVYVPRTGISCHIRALERPRKLPHESLCVPQAIPWAPVFRPIVLLSRETPNSLSIHPVTKLIIQATRHSRSLSNRIAFVSTRVGTPCPWTISPTPARWPRDSAAESCGAFFFVRSRLQRARGKRKKNGVGWLLR